MDWIVANIVGLIVGFCVGQVVNVPSIAKAWAWVKTKI